MLDHDVPEETVVPENTDVTIKCETLDAQKKVVWCKNREKIAPSERFVPESSPDHLRHYLKIKEVFLDDSGEYGVLIDGTYISVTKIKVLQGKKKIEFLYSLNLYILEDSIITSSIQESLDEDLVPVRQGGGPR